MTKVNPHKNYRVNNINLMKTPIRFGFIVIRGDRQYLQFELENEVVPINSVSFLRGRSNTLDGEHSYPKPFIYDENNDTILQSGDRLAILTNPDASFPYLVLGSIETNPLSPVSTGFTALGHDARRDRRENIDRIIKVIDDGNGEVKYYLIGQGEGSGNITVYVQGNGEDNGRFILATSKSVDIKSPKIHLGELDNEEQPIVLGRNLVTKLTTVLEQLLKPGNIVTSVGPAQFKPDVVLQLQSIKDDIESVLSTRNYTV